MKDMRKKEYTGTNTSACSRSQYNSHSHAATINGKINGEIKNDTTMEKEIDLHTPLCVCVILCGVSGPTGMPIALVEKGKNQSQCGSRRFRCIVYMRTIFGQRPERHNSRTITDRTLSLCLARTPFDPNAFCAFLFLPQISYSLFHRLLLLLLSFVVFFCSFLSLFLLTSFFRFSQSRLFTHSVQIFRGHIEHSTTLHTTQVCEMIGDRTVHFVMGLFNIERLNGSDQFRR